MRVGLTLATAPEREAAQNGLTVWRRRVVLVLFEPPDVLVVRVEPPLRGNFWLTLVRFTDVCVVVVLQGHHGVHFIKRFRLPTGSVSVDDRAVLRAGHRGSWEATTWDARPARALQQGSAL